MPSLTAVSVCERSNTAKIITSSTRLWGEKLHKGLINLTKEAERKRDNTIMEIFLQQELPDDITLRHPVFITENEADKFEAFHF